MTTITVTNASQLSSALNVAQAGDTISLAAGNYGDVSITGKTFAGDVTITSQNAGALASFHSLNIQNSAHIHVDDVQVAFTPTMSTAAWSPAVAINSSQSVAFTHSIVTAGAAINGVAASAPALDGTGNVLGLPTGYGVSVSGSSGVVVDGNSISQVAKGVVLYNADHLTISHNDIHDIRTSGIFGSGVSDTTVDSNHVHDSTPWRWGQTPVGDHADFLAFWTAAGQPAASNNIQITNNVMEQGKGTAILGMWLQGDTSPFTNVTISGNAFLDGNAQGIMLKGVSNASVDHNTLLQTSGDPNTAPGILLNPGSQNISVSNNITASVNDISGSTGAVANTIGVNQLIQHANPFAGGFYNSELIPVVEQAGASHSSIFAAGASGFTGPLQTQMVNDFLAAENVVLTTPGPGANVVGTYANDRLVGTGGGDTLISNGGTDTMIGGSGDDTYYVTGNASQIVEQAGGGVDTVIAKGNYVLQANIENLQIDNSVNNSWSGTGNALNNVIAGNGGDNAIDGAAGNDTISGGAGNNLIIGGVGDDWLIGGAGKDTFKFDVGSGHDVIADLSKTDHDVIDISTYLKAGLAPVLHDVGANMTMTFATGDSITLMGVHTSDLISTSAGFTL